MNRNMAIHGMFFALYASMNIHGMNIQIKKKIDQAEDRFRKQVYSSDPHSRENSQAYWDYNDDLAMIVHDAGHLMTKQEKLNHLYGDSRYQERRAIIKSMIEDDEVDPNTIKYQGVYYPLRESIDYADFEFAEYLIFHGAKPDERILKSENYKKLKETLQQNRSNQGNNTTEDSI